MMMMPAARSKSRLSGILTMEFAGSAIFSRAPLWPDEATTRSPTSSSVTPAPTLSITPATSAAGENGNGGWIWYLPWIISRSKKFSAADLMAITLSRFGDRIRHVGQDEIVGAAILRAEHGFHRHTLDWEQRGSGPFMPDLQAAY